MVLVQNSMPRQACGSSPNNKKQTKEERDRQKQIEKKKRRLEKALATSAAIRLELEKKKQKKKEEEKRLDEEGAALAEAVALNVLLDEEKEGFTHLESYTEFGIQGFGILSDPENCEKGSYLSYVSSHRPYDMRMAYNVYSHPNQWVSYSSHTGFNNGQVTFSVGQGTVEGDELHIYNREQKAVFYGDRSRKVDMASQAFAFLTIAGDANPLIHDDKNRHHGYT